MKISIFKILSIKFLLLSLICTNAQSLDFLIELEREDEIYFDYNYEEFNNNAYLDSTIILESFTGVQNLHKDSINYAYPQIDYYFTVEKIGKQIKRTFYDTISVENINTKFNIVIYELENTDTIGAENQITGWIFADTLLGSVVDTMDSIPMYPYNRLYRYYQPENDSSLFYPNDTLFIHYRPSTTNYFDSYFSTNYYIRKNHGLIYYSRNYWYYGEGFNESYKFTGAALIDAIKPSERIISSNFSLNQNYPNPFNPITNIRYSISEESYVRVIVYDILGNEIETIVTERQKKGEYEVHFNAGNLSSGVYYYRLYVGNNTITKKLILLK
ncbi:MAG: T9SS type A sorting domain-containing protein [Bacteroidetes bacterium]|nr:T9SS type A sorting domain-containing protein [Bacteroidota bacterium]